MVLQDKENFNCLHVWRWYWTVSMCGDCIAGQGELQLSPCVESVLQDKGNWTVSMCRECIAGEGELNCLHVWRLYCWTRRTSTVSMCGEYIAGQEELNCLHVWRWYCWTRGIELSPCVEMVLLDKENWTCVESVLLDMGNWTVSMCGDSIAGQGETVEPLCLEVCPTYEKDADPQVSFFWVFFQDKK